MTRSIPTARHTPRHQVRPFALLAWLTLTWAATPASAGDKPADPVLPPAMASVPRVLATGTMVARSIEERSSDSLNILDFGADPTGVKDSSPAIAATIAAAITGTLEPVKGVRSARKDIFAPCGSYRITTPVKLWSIWGLTFAGAGACTRFVVSAPMTAAFDLNGIAQSSFRNFSIRAAEPAEQNTFTYGIYLYWDPATSYRSTTSVRFQNLTVSNGRFVDAFRAGQPGAGTQVSETEWVHCFAQGEWKTGQNTWWQSAFHLGTGSWANNLNHSVFGSEITGVRYGVYADASNVLFRGGMIQRTESDLYAANIAGYLIADGFRSEGSQRLLFQPWVSDAKHITLSNIEWRVGPDLAADSHVIVSAANGTVLLQNVSFEGWIKTLCPKIVILNTYATLILDGVSVPFCSLGEVVAGSEGPVSVRGFVENSSNGAKRRYGDVIYAGEDGLAFGPRYHGDPPGPPDAHLFRTRGGMLATDKGIQHTETAPRPACDLAHRGLTWFTAGTAGAKDVFELCGKDAADAYQWRRLY